MTNTSNEAKASGSYNHHETCRQAFITEIGAARAFADAGQLAQARFHLLRANGAVAQGMVYADQLGIETAGWFSRMTEIMAMWERVNG